MACRLVWLALLFYVNVGQCGVTMEQIEKTAQMTRSVCQQRTKVSTEMADGIRVGKFPDDKALKCYVHCAFELSGIIKKNKVNYEGALKQMEMLLTGDLLEESKHLLMKCKDSANGIKDNCEAGFALVKCMYEHRYKNKEIFQFP